MVLQERSEVVEVEVNVQILYQVALESYAHSYEFR